MKETQVLIKIGDKTTSFIVTKNDKVVFWDAVLGGEYHIINDVSQCLRVKFSDAEQLTKAKSVCLSQAVGIKEENVLTEIIEARVEQIFEQIKEQLQVQGFLQSVHGHFITKDDNYIPNIGDLLSRIMNSVVKVIELKSINIKLSSMKRRIGELVDGYF